MKRDITISFRIKREDREAIVALVKDFLIAKGYRLYGKTAKTKKSI